MQEKSKETENIEIDLREIFGVLFHRLWIIVVAALVCGAVAFMYSFFVITPQYESTTKVYILNKQNASGSVTYSDVQLSSTLSKDYEQLVTSRYVIEGVINDLKLDETYESLVKRVSASNATDTRIIAITVTDPEPEQAQKIANSVRDLAAKHITEVMDIEAVNVVDQANLPDEPVSPSIPKWTIIGVLVGIVISAAVLSYSIFLMIQSRLLKILRDTLDSVHWHLSLLMKDRIVIRVREEYQYLQKVVQKPISL